MTIIRAKPEN